MKREFALVLETYDNNIAKVELQRSSSCEGCSICSSGKPIVLRALNNINAEKGDSVVIEVEELKKGLNFLVYAVPLICLIIGYVIGDYFSKLISIKQNLGPAFSFALFFNLVSTDAAISAIQQHLHNTHHFCIYMHFFSIF